MSGSYSLGINSLLTARALSAGHGKRERTGKFKLNAHFMNFQAVVYSF